MPTSNERVFLSLGSNIEPRQIFLERAIELLKHEIEITRCSSVFETEPWGYSDQASFLNLVVEGQTDLTPLQLLRRIKAIETDLGRQPTFRYGPRAIDIDILIYGEILFQTEELCIPHPHLAERAFVLVPFMELEPDLVIPGLEMTIRQAAMQCESLAGVHRI